VAGSRRPGALAARSAPEQASSRADIYPEGKQERYLERIALDAPHKRKKPGEMAAVLARTDDDATPVIVLTPSSISFC
jgi:hypothetical protein